MAGMIQQAMAPQEPMPDEQNDPAYAQAMAFVMEALYQQGAAKDMAKTLESAPDKVDALANTAYDIISIADEKTDGAIPDELLALFATKVLEEVGEIAEAAGVGIKPSDIALALKQMILRFLGEQGVDTTELQAAMDQVDPEEFNRLAEQEEMPA